ncbi:vascular cell adhesion protein 1-like isoform X1 [Boleophthalmus pectinirostris]|nr:vascular cell adhesion protein 1-like isoform X1 [Boleophthalmus pectinirostris]
MEALSGSCLQIPCTYTAPFKYIKKAFPATGMWFKQNYVYGTSSAFSVSGNPNMSYPMNFTGDLKNKDCNTMFYNLSQSHEDIYYFGLVTEFFTNIAVFNHLQITVRDFPRSPTIEVSGNQTETEVLTITCSAVTPCPLAPPLLTWDPHQDTAHITETNADRTLTTKITQNISVTDAHDGLVIKCNASYPVRRGFKMSSSNVTLSVSYGPKDTSVAVSPSGPLSAGESVALSCSSRAKPPVHLFTWFRHSPKGAARVSQGHTYSFNFTQDGQYYCVASNTLGNETSAVITLSKTEPGVVSWIGPYNVVKLCGIILLYGSLVLFECWFRTTYAKKQEQRPDANVRSAIPSQS